MRKLLSVLLAVLIVASVAVVSFSAARGPVPRPLPFKSVKGDTVTKTYAVGETFTTYTLSERKPDQQWQDRFSR